MGTEYVDVCNLCGKMVVKSSESESTDMVHVLSLELLYLSDEYPPGKLSRPGLNLTGDVYCPSCLLQVIKDWVKELAGIPASTNVAEREVVAKEGGP